jgi:L-malate glycosyltransferase
MRPRLFLFGDSMKVGGTEGQFAEVACGLDRSRWDVTIGCVRAEGPLRSRFDAAGIRVESWGPGSLRSPRAILAVSRLARYLRAQRIDLVHSFDFYSNILGILAARLARVALVVASQRDLGDIQLPMHGRIHRILLRLADHVLVNAQVIADRLCLGRTVASDRVVVVPNGVDILRFHPATGRRPGSGGAVTVGTLANLRPEKGVLDMAQAAGIVREQCADARFIIWGDGPLRPQLERLIETHGLAGSVELRGATADPAAALRELDIFVLASHSEACSNALLEAMATRLPIVATNVGGNPALLEDEATGLLVPPGDPRGLAKAVLRLIEDRALAAEFADRALQRVHAEFTIGRMMDRLQDFYGRALAGRHA